MGVFTKPVYEEPSEKLPRGKYMGVLTELAKSPGTWGKIGEYSSSSSAYQARLNLEKGKYRIWDEPDAWTFVDDGDAVFARYDRT